jgi:hypothetical protein
VDQAELLRHLVETFQALGIPYMIGGAQAAIFYGEPRLTRDIDVIADVEFAHIAGLRQHFPDPEFYLSEDAAREAIQDRGQFNIIHPTSGLKIDVILSKTAPYDQVQFSRRERHEIVEGRDAYFASPEDVILYKMIYFREGGGDRHVRDILGMLTISSEPIDRGYIAEWALRLGLEEIWQSILTRARAEHGR